MENDTGDQQISGLEHTVQSSGQVPLQEFYPVSIATMHVADEIFYRAPLVAATMCDYLAAAAFSYAAYVDPALSHQLGFAFTTIYPFYHGVKDTYRLTQAEIHPYEMSDVIKFITAFGIGVGALLFRGGYLACHSALDVPVGVSPTAAMAAGTGLVLQCMAEYLRTIQPEHTDVEGIVQRRKEEVERQSKR
jgi:hypothetical protein